jgi:hypothetical protein
VPLRLVEETGALAVPVAALPAAAAADGLCLPPFAAAMSSKPDVIGFSHLIGGTLVLTFICAQCDLQSAARLLVLLLLQLARAYCLFCFCCAEVIEVITNDGRVVKVRCCCAASSDPLQQAQHCQCLLAEAALFCR